MFPETDTLAGVQCTTDYDQFKSIVSNREVSMAHVKRLATKIEKKNLLAIRPIDVTSNLEVVDGQHRLEAARLLGLPIYYQVTEQLTKADIAELNSVSKNWSAMDYLNFWCVEKKPSYLLLSKFLSHYPKMSLSAAQMLLSGGDTRSAQLFQQGEYEASEAHHARAAQLADHCGIMATEFRFEAAYDGRFVQALAQCSREDGFGWTNLLHKIRMQPRSLVRCPTQKAYIELLEELYNYKTRDENRVRFR